MKQVVKDDITMKDFNALYRERKKEAEEDPDLCVSWLGTGRFEVTCDRWADSYIYQYRPDNWPIRDGEPL